MPLSHAFDAPAGCNFVTRASIRIQERYCGILTLVQRIYLQQMYDSDALAQDQPGQNKLAARAS